MNVATQVEGFDHARVTAERRHDAQLDLGIVCRKDLKLLRTRHEGFADFAAAHGADGNVLQVRVGGTQASRSSNGLVVRSMDSARVGINQQRQRVHVGGFELL